MDMSALVQHADFKLSHSPTYYALVLTYEHIVVQIKNITIYNITKVVAKSTV